MLKQFLKHTNIDPKLARAVIRQMGGWENLKNSAPDIVNHGIDGGFGGFVYYSDTCAFFKRNRKLIMKLAEDQANDFGQGMLEMIQGFGVFRHDPISTDSLARALYQGKGDDVVQVENVMSWFAAEEVARAYEDWRQG